ncbi:MAG: SDR family oxidoreductase [Pseudomonadota bacterium]
MGSGFLDPTKNALITGATSGIGKAAARKLAQTGAKLTLVGRNAGKLERTIDEIRRESGNDAIDGLTADLASVSEVRTLADAYRNRHDSLHVLLNNAGAIFTARTMTREGIERTIALNHLAYFELSRQLLDLMRKSAPARIINVASQLHEKGEINFADIGLSKGYAPIKAYAQSKLANVMFTFELARRLSDDGITVNALHPGMVASGFGKNNTGLVGRTTGLVLGTLQRIIGVSAEEGADTAVYLATAPEVAGETGQYWNKRKVTGTSAISLDSDQCARLWDLSENMVETAIA